METVKKGSLTVEIALLSPMILTVLFLTVSLCIFVHHRVWLSQAAYEAALTGTCLLYTSLSDLLYYVRQENTNLIHKLSTVVCSIENLDYVPPVLSPVDLHETTQEEWERLLREIALHSNYEVLLLDIGESACQTYQLLEKCKKIYMPVLTDWISQAKVEQFEKLMRIWDMKEILGKIEKLKLPYYTSKERGVEYVKQLMWSELGDYTKELVRREMG